MFFDTGFGIDFREDHLILTYLKRYLTKIRLVDYGVYPLSTSLERDERENNIFSFINEFILRNHINKKNISISIPREKVVLRFIRLPATTKENLRKVLEYETPRYSPFEKGEVYFDYQILREDKKWLDLCVVFVKKTDVDKYLSLLKTIGIIPISVQIPSTSAINLFHFNSRTKNKKTSILLEVGESFSEINIIGDRGEWKESFLIPIQREDKELRIKESLKKIEIKDNLSEKRFFIFGLSADETAIRTIKDANNIEEVAVPPISQIDIKKRDELTYQIYSSIGTSLSGLARVKLNINLLPLNLRKKVKRIGKPILIIFIVMAIILSLSWGAGVLFHYKKTIYQLTEEIKKRRPSVEALDRLKKEKENLIKEIGEFEKIREGEISKILILNELTKILPSNAWILNLRYKAKEVEINGYAESSSDLVQLLDKSPLFEKVEFLAPVTKEKYLGTEGVKEKERFKMKFKIE